MKILHTIQTVKKSSGGPARSVPELVRHLQRLNLSTNLWVNEAEEESGLQNPEYSSGSFNALFDQIGVPDILHDHGIWLLCNHRVATLSRKRELCRIVSPRGMLEPWSLNHSRWKKRCAWWLYQRSDLMAADSLHATCDNEAHQFRALGFRQPIAVIPNGVAFPSNLPERSCSRTSSGVREFVFLSRIHPKKGLLMLVDAWHQVARAGWRIRIVGPDEQSHRAQVQQRIQELNRSGDFVFQDAVDDVKKWQILADADVTILPTFSENFGIIVAESLAAATPVITTTGTPWEELEQRSCGWYVRPEVQEIATAMHKAMELSDDERRVMGDRGSVLVAEKYSWPGIAGRMLDCYNWLLTGGAPPADIRL